jgi:serine/threonine protein kinase
LNFPAGTSNELPSAPTLSLEALVRQLPAPFGRYRLVRVLGQGGMGAVFLAHDTQLDRAVALKIPNFSAAESTVLLERFYREARAAATLNHPNLCPVHDVGQQDGLPYLTMSYLEGKSLSALIKSGEPLPVRTAVLLVRILASALQEAHQRGVIHRDLKPANIMMTTRKQPVIMDFGLARRSRSETLSTSPPVFGPPADIRLTQTGSLMGTPAYMAPEQVRGDVASMGASCDIYSLGVILYELLTGRLPFQGSLEALLGQILFDEPAPPSQFRPELDPALDAICRKALAKEPAHRFPSMSAFAGALNEFLQGHKSEAAPAGPAIPDPGLGSLFGDLAVPPVFKKPPRRQVSPTPLVKRPLVLAGGALSLGLVILIIVLMAGRNSPPPGSHKTALNSGASTKKAGLATEPAAPAFQLLPMAALTLKTGTTKTFPIQIERHGYQGAIRIEGKTLPDGVLLQAGTLPEGKESLDLEWTVATVAPPGNQQATLTAVAGGRRHEVSFPISVEKALLPRLMAIAPIVLRSGERKPVHVEVERRDWQGPIKLSWGELPSGLICPETTVPSDRQSIDLELSAAPGSRGIVQLCSLRAYAEGDLAQTVPVQLTILPSVAVIRELLLPVRAPAPKAAPSKAECDKALEVLGKAIRPPAKPDRASLERQARELWVEGEKIKDNPVVRYALWDKARELALRARDPILAVGLSDDLAMAFNLPELGLKTTALHTIYAAIPKEQTRFLPPAERVTVNRDLAEVALDVVQDALAAGSEQAAIDLVKLAEDAILRITPKGGVLHQRVIAQRQVVTQALKHLQELRQAADALDRAAGDPQANLAAGKHLCFDGGIWDQGILLLAQGGDSFLAQLARDDLMTAKSPQACRARGDAWWQHGLVQAGIDAAPYFWRASSWYEQALADLSEPDRNQLEQKIRAVRAAPDLRSLPPDLDLDYAAQKPSRFEAGPVQGSYQDRKLILRMPEDKTNWTWYIGYEQLRSYGSFACQVVGRITGPRSGGWEVVAAGDEGQHAVFCRIDSDAVLHLAPTWDRLRYPHLPEELIRHRVLRGHGETNTILLVGHGRVLEIYVNGLAVRDPFVLERGLLHRIGFAPGASAWDQGARVELEEMKIWVGDKVPPSLAVRAAQTR